MEDLIRNAAVFGSLLGMALLAWRSRWRVSVPAGAVALGIALALWLQVLGPGWRSGLPVSTVGLALGWAAFTRTAAAAGGPTLSGPAWIVAPLLGALVGDWGAAILLGALAPTRGVAARWILAAMAGAMLSEHGTPAVLVLGSSGTLTWLPLLLLGIAAPPGHLRNTGKASVTASVLLVTVLAWALPGIAALALALGSLFLGATNRDKLDRDLGRDLLAIGLIALSVGLARHSGVLSELRWAVELALQWGTHLGAGVVTLLAALGAAVTGEIGLAVVLGEALDTAAVVLEPGMAPALAAGLAVGGLGPLWITGSLRVGAGRWALTLAAAVLWSAYTLQ